MTQLSRTMAENMRRFLDGEQPSRDQEKTEYKTKDLSMVEVFENALGGRQEKETEEGISFCEQLLRTIHELGI